ncbi:MAG TPA: serine/threonine-protein kinase [Polyangiaceae bacterium]|nr:serine/threonine-protein kinase [Polyangiaceae bacterium]
MAPATDDAELPDSELSERHRIGDARVGQVIGGSYRIVRYIGSGGSSHVFQAEHLRLGKAFAIKLLREGLDNNRRAAQRFRREAKAIARLNSEHIVSVVDCGELDDGTPYLVMELLEGEDLRSLLNREGSLPARRAVQIVIEACRGLTVVHEAGLIHRDLKPENLFITKRATGEDWCKVLDFGVAKMEASLSTAQGAIVGTVRYMAPEQLGDGAAVGPATDVYALGAVLYECFSGRAAFDGDTIQQVMFGVMNREPAALAELCPNLPRELVAVVEHCLSKTVNKRPRSATELAGALSAAIGSAIGAVPHQTLSDAAPVVIVRQGRGSYWTIAAAMLVASVAAASIAWLAKPSVQDAPPRLDTPRANPNAAAKPVDPAAPPPAAAESPIPVIPASPVPVPASAASPADSGLPPHHKALARAVTKPEKASTPASVGRFDPANPYGQ